MQSFSCQEKLGDTVGSLEGKMFFYLPPSPSLSFSLLISRIFLLFQYQINCVPFTMDFLLPKKLQTLYFVFLREKVTVLVGTYRNGMPRAIHWYFFTVFQLITTDGSFTITDLLFRAGNILALNFK